MRTTLTVDDDVIRQLRQIARDRHQSLKKVTNETLRRGLTLEEKQNHAEKPFEVQPKSCGFLPGIDPLKLNQLVDEEETEDFIDRQQKGITKK